MASSSRTFLCCAMTGPRREAKLQGSRKTAPRKPRLVGRLQGHFRHQVDPGGARALQGEPPPHGGRFGPLSALDAALPERAGKAAAVGGMDFHGRGEENRPGFRPRGQLQNPSQHPQRRIPRTVAAPELPQPRQMVERVDPGGPLRIPAADAGLPGLLPEIHAGESPAAVAPPAVHLGAGKSPKQLPQDEPAHKAVGTRQQDMAPFPAGERRSRGATPDPGEQPLQIGAAGTGQRIGPVHRTPPFPRPAPASRLGRSLPRSGPPGEARGTPGLPDLPRRDPPGPQDGTEQERNRERAGHPAILSPKTPTGQAARRPLRGAVHAPPRSWLFRLPAPGPRPAGIAA